VGRPARKLSIWPSEHSLHPGQSILVSVAGIYSRVGIVPHAARLLGGCDKCVCHL